MRFRCAKLVAGKYQRGGWERERERNACERACTDKDGCTKGDRERESSGEETDGVVEGRFYTDNVQSLCMRLTGATAS